MNNNRFYFTVVGVRVKVLMTLTQIVFCSRDSSGSQIIDLYIVKTPHKPYTLYLLTVYTFRTLSVKYIYRCVH